MTTPLYRIGDKIYLKSTPGTHGRIVEEPRRHRECFEYCVLVNNRESWFAESDLCKAEPGIPVWMKRDAFLRDMLLVKLTHPFSDSLYSYRASRTEFAAYQFRPVLKFLNNPDQRILIADEVGLGKTIEACIIYLELKARLSISKVLIICPSRLRQKWQDELRNRFEEDFRYLDSAGLHHLLDDYDRTQGTIPFRAIVSYETIRRTDFLQRMVQSHFKLDMVIIDEAHYMRNSDTATHQAGAIITDNADAVVFLTATPLHLGNQDLYNLLHLLSPGDYYEGQLFPDLVSPNIHINQAARLLAAGDAYQALHELRRVETTRLKRRFENNPIYASVKERLRCGAPTDRSERIQLQQDLLELNTLSQIFTRTRKRDVSSAAVRAAYSVVVTLTPEEHKFYLAVLRHIRQELRRTNFGAISFAIVTKERMAASCLGALREKYQRVQNERKQPTAIRLQRETTYYDPSDEDQDEHDDLENTELSYDELLVRLARQAGPSDSKFNKLVEILEGIIAEEDTKILVFSSFRDTLAYLEKRLSDLGYRPGVIHGDVKITDRQAIIDHFRTSQDFRILLSSEVGAEGLDFQFCGVLINYDLPWNPMQVEQRIGRLDRFGQLHERIRIYNFYLEGTIETRILGRLYDRIGIFTQTVGDLEAILGEEIRHLSRKVLQSNLTSAEEERLADEVADQIIRKRLEEERLEARRDEFLGQDAIFNQQVESAISSGRVIHPDEVCAAVRLFLKAEYEGTEFTRDFEEPTWTLTIGPGLTAALRRYLSDNRQKALVFSERFQTAMACNKQIALTFDSEYARKRPLLEFVTYNHLLADLAIDYWRSRQEGIPALRGILMSGSQTDAGDGFFFIYALDESGARNRRTLVSVVVLDDGHIADTASQYIMGRVQQQAEDTILEWTEESFDRAQQVANSWIADERDRRRSIIASQNEALISARSAAIEQSYKAKIGRAEEALNKVSEIRITRMYEGQRRNLQAEMNSKLEAIQKGRQFNISYNLVALGRVRIVVDEYEQKLPRLVDNDKLLVQSFSAMEDLPEVMIREQMESIAAPESELNHASDKKQQESESQRKSVFSWLISRFKSD